MNEPGNDLNDEDRVMLRRLARDQAVRAVGAAINATLTYAEYVHPNAAADEHAMKDEAYRQILDVCVSLGDAKAKLAEVEVVKS